jgi:hypothetical protein
MGEVCCLIEALGLLLALAVAARARRRRLLGRGRA